MPKTAKKDILQDAFGLVDKEDFSGALVALSRYIESNPQSQKDLAKAYAARGFCHTRLDSGDKYNYAFDDLSQSILLAPSDYAYILRGYVYMLCKKDYAQALSDFKEAYKLNPKEVRAVEGRGLALYRLGRYSQAEKWLESAVEMGDLYSVETYHFLGEIYRKRKENYLKAITFYEQSKSKMPSSCLGMGLCYYELNQMRNAIMSIETALESGLDSEEYEIALRYLKKLQNLMPYASE